MNAIKQLIEKSRKTPALAPVYALELDRLLRGMGQAPLTFSGNGVAGANASAAKALGLGQLFEAQSGTPTHTGGNIHQAEMLVKQGKRSEALSHAFANAQGPEVNALNLLYANHATSNPKLRLHFLNKYLAEFGLEIELEEGWGKDFFHQIKSAQTPSKVDGPLVTVIMPAYNAERTIELAIGSLLNQTWQNLQIIVVDDSSTDATLQKAKDLAKRDPRVEVLSSPVNVGPYVCRNLGVLHTRGQWLTVHDADDWAFPDRIQQQVQALTAGNALACTGRMLRMNEQGQITRPIAVASTSEDGYMRLCFVSLMMQTAYFRNELGAWDSVRVGGDAELIDRLKVLGTTIKHLCRPLMLCLDHEAGLTNNQAFGLYDETGQTQPLRAEYKQAFTAWQRAAGPKKMPAFDQARPFDAPKANLVEPGAIKKVFATWSNNPEQIKGEERFNNALQKSQLSEDKKVGLGTSWDCANNRNDPLCFLLPFANETNGPISNDVIQAITPAELDLLYAKGVFPKSAPIRHPELVSILMPSYNNEQWLTRAIHSALSQQGVEVEVILVDDGSTDGSVSLARKISQKCPNLKVISLLRNFGCYYARNIGLMHAKGEFITVLDSDDIQPLDSISRQLDALKKVSGAMACRGQQRRWSVDFTSPISDLKYGESNLLWRRDIIQLIGFYDTVRYSGDSEFRLRFERACGIDALVKIPDEVYYARTISGSLTLSSSSGVFNYSEGKISVAISQPRKAYKENFDNWQKNCKPNLNISFPQITRSFDLGAKEQNASPSLGQRRIGTMASFPPRRESLKAVVGYILPQLDELRIYLNDYEEIPDFLIHPKIKVTLSKNAVGDLRDNGKFYHLPDGDNIYFFSFDDDLVYPPDYVCRMIHYIEMLGRFCIVGVHGVNFPILELKDLNQREVFHFKQAHEGRFVDLLGTGTTAWHSSTFRPSLKNFVSQGVCDLWFAQSAIKEHIPLFSIPREEGWLKLYAEYEFSLFSEAKSDPDIFLGLYEKFLVPSLNQSLVRRDAMEHLERSYDRDTLIAAGIFQLDDSLSISTSLRSIRRHAKFLNPLPPTVKNKELKNNLKRLHFHIVVNGWNCSEYMSSCLRSIAEQIPNNYDFDVTLIDDQSTDGTFEDLVSGSILPYANLIRITKNTGPAHARHIGIKSIVDPQTIVVLLDMDDALEPQALKIVAKCYRQNPECLMTIGNWHDQSGKLNPQTFYTSEEIDKQLIRTIEIFNASHLRTFRRRLYDAIEDSDLLDHEGKWLETCTDVAIMYPLLDQCFSNQVEFINEPIYRYTRKHSGGTLARFGKPHKVERLQWLKSKLPKPRLGKS